MSMQTCPRCLELAPPTWLFCACGCRLGLTALELSLLRTPTTKGPDRSSLTGRAVEARQENRT